MSYQGHVLHNDKVRQAMCTTRPVVHSVTCPLRNGACKGACKGRRTAVCIQPYILHSYRLPPIQPADVPNTAPAPNTATQPCHPSNPAIHPAKQPCTLLAIMAPAAHPTPPACLPLCMQPAGRCAPRGDRRPPGQDASEQWNCPGRAAPRRLPCLTWRAIRSASSNSKMGS